MEHDTTSSILPASTTPARGLRRRTRQLARDYAYVLPGLPVAAISFPVLVALTAVSLGTLVVWVGALLLPLTLMIASSFAGLSRHRVSAWGRVPVPVEYRAAHRGLRGAVQIVAEPRRWLDLAFETVIAFPLRLVTFVVAVTWTGIALGGATHWFWSRFLPTGSEGWEHLLSFGFPELVPDSDRGVYLLDSGINLALGVIFLLTLPTVLRGLASLDALLTVTLLGQSTAGHPDGPGDDDRIAGTAGAGLPAFSTTGWAWVSTTFSAVVLVVIGWPVLAAVHGVHPAIAMVLTVGHSASIVLAVRWARAGIGLATLAVLATMLATSDLAAATVWPWPVTSLLVQCLLVAVVALRHAWWWAITAWAAGALATVAAFVLIAGGIPDGGLANGVVLVSVSAGLGLLGIVVRLWRQSASRVAQAEELSVEEAQRRRDLQERNRIARELHDVVAHSMSVINVQASTAQYRKPGIDAGVEREFEDIAESTRRALGEMRALLAILRNDDTAPTAPVPGLTDIDDLVEATRASGASISYSGVDAEVSATVGLTAFRLIQEALSNALRHAPGASIEVTTAIDHDGDALAVEVVNAAPTGAAASAPGAGLGLAGVRERVTALGATVEAGPTSSGGFSVSASLPLDHGRGRTD